MTCPRLDCADEESRDIDSAGSLIAISDGDMEGARIVTFSAGGAHGLARLASTDQLSLLGGFPAEATPRPITAGPGNTLWVTAEVNLKPGVVVRVSGLEQPVVTPPLPIPKPPLPITPGKPQTRLGKGPRGVVKATKSKETVKFSFSATVPGSSFQCSLTKGKNTIRARGAGGVDPTPAKRSFRVALERR